MGRRVLSGARLTRIHDACVWGGGRGGVRGDVDRFLLLGSLKRIGSFSR